MGACFMRVFYVYGKTNSEIHVVDARPSDAIAIAIRSEAPHFYSRACLSKSGGTDWRFRKREKK